MTARPLTRLLGTALAAALVATLLTLLPGLAPGASATTRPAPTKARLVKVVQKVAFPRGTKPGKIETLTAGGSDNTLCGYRFPATVSVSRSTHDDALSVGYLPTTSAAKARAFVQKVRAKRSCEDGALKRTTLKGAPKGTAVLVLELPVDETHVVRLYLAFAPTGRSIAVATAGTKKDTATLLTNAVRAYQKAKLA
jgi:hypothetical protein